MNVEMIPLDQIAVGDRLRSVDPDWVALIAASMREHGQRVPLEVRKLNVSKALERTGKKYELIAGAHREAALREIGADTAACVVLKVTDLEAQLLEIDENLCRRELSPLDRATFLAERKRVYEELHPETKRGGDRRSDQSEEVFALIASFTTATAERLGLTKRAIEIAVARHRNIVPDVRSKIAGTWIADSGAQLDALAKETPEMQRRIADFIAQWPGIRQVGEIVRQIENRPKAKPPTAYQKFIGVWKVADAGGRSAILDYLRPEVVNSFEDFWHRASAEERSHIIDFLSPQHHRIGRDAAQEAA
ncbi:putative transcriptional regulator [Gluconacetobacter sacchari DSM 12717]|uniref:ParB N-terminal domain-containing protein n=2 Tax=Gluconacetobacter sacchari TaxID=92759 RepID=A0A7W4NLR3_9PROT|nr:ParB N-terminal domain-containing protein [Gluconacetobacter sacchari]MBB2160121.1 ParB N-terminal domain-containing protein [Gluconacetobacter sacchari]GBQ25035.1 putative transcriptional regulator [Gluconacetobacter sacchari DSM 12717]